MKIAVTGANSSVGQTLLKHLAAEDDFEIVAGVRNEKAFANLPDSPRITPRVIDYFDNDSLTSALTDCDCVVHLAGILIENRGSTYATANVAATAAAAEAAAAAGVTHFIFVSVVGASPDSGNAYFRSKGTAEEIVKQAGMTASILRTPMLLGPGTAGAASLVGSASNAQAKVLGGGHYAMRPLDIDDLSAAIVRLCRQPGEGHSTHELVGPESIAYRDLIRKTAALMNREVEVTAVPIWPAKLGAALSSIIKGGGISPTVIDVITTDEVVSENADQALGISLSSLDNTLQKIISAHRP